MCLSRPGPCPRWAISLSCCRAIVAALGSIKISSYSEVSAFDSPDSYSMTIGCQFYPEQGAMVSPGFLSVSCTLSTSVQSMCKCFYCSFIEYYPHALQPVAAVADPAPHLVGWNNATDVTTQRMRLQSKLFFELCLRQSPHETSKRGLCLSADTPDWVERWGAASSQHFHQESTYQ